MLGKSQNETFHFPLIHSWAKGEVYKISESDQHHIQSQSHMHWAFVISGLIAIGNSIVIIIIYIFIRPKDVTTCIHLYVKYDFSSDKKTDLKEKKPWFFKVLCLYLFLCCAALSIENVGTEFYIFPVAILSGLGFIVTDASIFNILFHFLVVTSRILTGYILKFFTVRKVLLVSLTLSVITGGLLAFVGFKSYVLFWILACLLSLFFGNTYPSHMALVNTYTKVTGFMVAFTEMGLSVSIFITVWASGALLDFVGPHAVLIEFWLGVCICLVITVGIYIMGDSIEKQLMTDDKMTDDHEPDEKNPLFS